MWQEIYWTCGVVGAIGDRMAKTKLEEIVEDIERIASDVGKDPWKLTSRDYYGNGGEYTEWDIRKLGGLQAIINDSFAEELQKDLEDSRGLVGRTKYTAKLQRDIGDWRYWTNQFNAGIKSALKEFPIQIQESRKNLTRKVKNLQREVICHISDTHLGLTIDPEEVEGNIYNWEIAARRFSLLAQEVANYKLDHRDECGRLVINCAGDFLCGAIHTDDHNTELLTLQIVGAARYIIAFIDYQLQFYSKILVPVATGNHDRLMTPSKGKNRALAQKYDGYGTVLFEMVQQAFRQNPNVEFVIPKTPYTTYRVFGRPFWTTHGDTVIEIGNPSKTIDIGKIVAKVDAINSVLDTENRMQVLLLGHTHTGVYVGLDSAVDLFINPSMSGIDPFAQSIGVIRPARPGQWLFESSKDYRVGDQRLISLSSADDDSSLNNIIPTFTGTLRLEK